ILGQLRTMMNGAKFLGDQDFLAIGQQSGDPTNIGNYHVTQFTTRGLTTVDTLKALVLEIESIAPVKAVFDGANPDSQILDTTHLNKIYKNLAALKEFGVPNTIPAQLHPLEKDWPILMRQLVAGLKESHKRLADANQNLAKIGISTAPHLIVEHTSAVFKSIFGKSFMAIPQFTLSNLAVVKKQVDEAHDPTKGILRHSNALVMEKWLHGIAKVREKLYAVELLASGIESLNATGITILPAQLSYKEGDYWLGTEYPATYNPDGDKLSINIIQPEYLAATSVGILVDDWVEIIPNHSETTGLTFNYNQPNAMPPQSLLLAVNPKDTQNWTWDNLLLTLKDTLALSKIRAVEPDHIEKSRYALVLPSIVAEVVPSEVKDDDGNALGVQVALDFINNNP
ncbi:MAG TPA: hypothetical protein VL947_04185, partial [Cytophagales bacterium]|nr:hypothetical protein [Cytophagales bacterium]